jgi:hypothetical protein
MISHVNLDGENPNAEIRRPKEIRKPNPEWLGAGAEVFSDHGGVGVLFYGVREEPTTEGSGRPNAELRTPKEFRKPNPEFGSRAYWQHA